MGARWAVVTTLGMLELFAARRVAEGLALPVYVPRYRERIGGSSRVREAVLFSRYIFVDGAEDFCYEIRKTRGVCSVLMIDGRVAILPEKAVVDLKAREDRDGFIWLKAMAEIQKFRKDQQVRVTAGAFCGLTGIHSGMSVKDRERVLIDMLGRKQVPIEVSARDLIAA